MSGADAVDEQVDDQGAADLLGVEPGRIDVMVAEGLLDPVADGPRRFRRTDVVALREAGG